MPTPEKTSGQEARTRKKRPEKSRTAYAALLLIGIVMLLMTTAYGLYRISSTAQSPPPIPAYEAYLSHGMEAKIKALDHCIFEALLTLRVPPENVVFKSVDTKRDQEEQWTYSDLEVWFPETIPLECIEGTFSRQLGDVIPEELPKFILGPGNDPILEISVNGRPTHRLTFVALHKRTLLRSEAPTLPRVAIIIDDLGYDQNIALKFLEIDGPLSFSVLPHSPFQQPIATAIHKSGRDVLLHLPMEPIEYPDVDPGDGALIGTMDPEELSRQLKQDLDSVPFVVGVNNHMGSKLTQDSRKMRQIFGILKERNLFFIDSVTSPGSCCAEVASHLQLRFARRHVFLDNTQDANAIRFQIKRLVSLAKKQGHAIGIAHPHPVTWEVLQEEIPKMRQELQLVRVSELLG